GGWLGVGGGRGGEGGGGGRVGGAGRNVESARAVSVRVWDEDDREGALLPIRANRALYSGGMGAKKKNFQADLMGRMGFEAEARKIQELFLDGKRDQAIMAVPSEFADEISLVGSKARIRDRLNAWRDTPVTSLLVGARNPDDLRTFAELVLG
ncbi:MAG: LLM class flavin-dependent oxidoreductase, partial [Pseudomonadales bacterium]|nr:LLM class flavin-dependent oxidoreductase [Pseudomonadales bacterium]